MKSCKKFKASIVIPFVTMADIAFLLLIFLIVTSSVQKSPDIKLVLPDSTQFDKISKTENTEIFVTDINEIIINNVKYSLKKLPNVLSYNKQSIINADKEADFKTIYQIIELLKKSNYEKISFAIKRKTTLKDE